MRYSFAVDSIFILTFNFNLSRSLAFSHFGRLFFNRGVQRYQILISIRFENTYATQKYIIINFRHHLRHHRYFFLFRIKCVKVRIRLPFDFSLVRPLILLTISFRSRMYFLCHCHCLSHDLAVAVCRRFTVLLLLFSPLSLSHSNMLLATTCSPCSFICLSSFL